MERNKKNESLNVFNVIMHVFVFLSLMVDSICSYFFKNGIGDILYEELVFYLICAEIVLCVILGLYIYCNSTIKGAFSICIKAINGLPESLAIAVYVLYYLLKLYSSFAGNTYFNYLDQLKCAINGEEWVCERHQTRKDQSIPIKGIIFDTNKTYSEDAMFEMLTSNKISAYGDASRFVDSFNVGDYAFYYEKGKGIVAVGRILSDTVCLENSDDREKFREVKIIVPSVIPYNEKELCAISAAELKKLVGHGFYFASTTKRPYLSEEESVKITNRLETLYREVVLDEAKTNFF